MSSACLPRRIDDQCKNRCNIGKGLNEFCRHVQGTHVDRNRHHKPEEKRSKERPGWRAAPKSRRSNTNEPTTACNVPSKPREVPHAQVYPAQSRKDRRKDESSKLRLEHADAYRSSSVGVLSDSPNPEPQRCV